MSSGMPRKFSEKIAIQQRKLNEDQSAFDQIMAEVHSITRNVTVRKLHASPLEEFLQHFALQRESFIPPLIPDDGSFS
ncbi:hypothetical protein D918_07904 [Trichuris suis]|nr:hypothetical protein D918_07904 [Trichuris suis]